MLRNLEGLKYYMCKLTLEECKLLGPCLHEVLALHQAKAISAPQHLHICTPSGLGGQTRWAMT
jgi:hypothetical protein